MVARLIEETRSMPGKQWTISEIAKLTGFGRKTIDYQVRTNMESHTEPTLTGDVWVVESYRLYQWAEQYLPAMLARQRAKEASNG